MAKHEGIRRIKIVGKLMMLLGATLATLIWILTGPASSIFTLLLLLPGPVLLGGLVWALGWILEGFYGIDRT